MRIAEALDVLGLERLDVERTALRRQYMRLLREHPPERDPDGFKRLREAFELLRRFAADDAPVSVPAVAPSVVVEASRVEASRIEPEPRAEVEPPLVEPEPRAEVEPPLVEAEPPPVHPEPVEPEPPPVRADPPRPRADLPRIAPPPVAPDPPLALTVLVGKLLELLREGLVEPAAELERDWRSGGDVDDFRGSSAMVAARWVLLRELLPITIALPVPVVRALASAIAEDDVSLARPALEGFQRGNPALARGANGLLAARAPTLFTPIRDTLAPPVVETELGRVYGDGRNPRPATPPAPPRSYAPPLPRASSGSGRGIWIGIVAVGAIVRLVASMGSGTSSSSYNMPKYDLPDVKSLQMPAPPSIDYDKLAQLSQPLPFEITDTSPATLSAEILRYTDFIRDMLVDARPEHQRFAATMRGAVVTSDCKLMRSTLDKWLAFSPLDSATGSDVVPLIYLEPIQQRVDLMCPKPTKHGKRPASAKHT
ncbi:MAG TPA: hypothetical protein VGG74_32225 [Kofleriaceae bacterium]|jgi:hypothetical protein